MGILIEAWGTEDLTEWRAAWARHEAHLRSIRDRLPPATRAFAEAPWHYDSQDPCCPHDAWVEYLHASEPARGKRRQRRRIDVEVRLPGAYHDGYITLRYCNVASYRLEQPSKENRLKYEGHGDWLTDDIGLSPTGLVVHEVTFRDGAAWYIECEDVSYEWEDGSYGPETLDLEPISDEELAEVLEEAVGALSASDRALFEEIKVLPFRRPCIRSEDFGVEDIFVIAVSGVTVLAYDEVEMKFVTGTRGSGEIINFSRSHLELSFALQSLRADGQ
jgi:hypothetical protein